MAAAIGLGAAAGEAHPFIYTPTDRDCTQHSTCTVPPLILTYSCLDPLKRAPFTINCSNVAPSTFYR